MRLSTYEHEEARIIDAMFEAQPGTETYQTLLQSYASLLNAALYSIDVKERLACVEENEASDAPITPLRPIEPEPEPPETEVAEPAVSFDELKSRFTAAARSGVNVGAVINQMGYGKLSDVPPSEYGALLDALAEASS